MASNVQLFLGATPILESYLGDKFTEYNISSSAPVLPSPTTTNLDMWFDGSTYSGTGNWLSTVNNVTASLFGVTKATTNGGVLNFQSSSILEVTQSGIQPNYSTIGAGGQTIIVVTQASGSAALAHGRLINDNDNWLFGTYGNASQNGWYNFGGFVVNGGGAQDYKWKIYAGVAYSSTSSSMFVNNSYVGGQGALVGGRGPNGIMINKGAYITSGNPASGEYTYTTLGQLMFYSRALTTAELDTIFNYFSGSYL
jgi:hypothetical protein